MKYIGMGSRYWDDIRDAQTVLHITLSSLGIVLGVWVILIDFISDKDTQ